MTVTAPPRPRDPVDREQLEALVEALIQEALIEEARQCARRRRRRYAAVAAFLALAGVALFTVFDRAAQSETASPALAARSSLSGVTASSKIAFIRMFGPQSNTELYVVNADGSEQRRLTRNAANDDLPAWFARRAEDRLRKRQLRQRKDLRHERRRERAAEADARLGARRPADLVARRAEDRLRTRSRRQLRDLRRERRRQRAAKPDAEPAGERRLVCLVARAEEVARDP